MIGLCLARHVPGLRALPRKKHREGKKNRVITQQNFQTADNNRRRLIHSRRREPMKITHAQSTQTAAKPAENAQKPTQARAFAELLEERASSEDALRSGESSETSEGLDGLEDRVEAREQAREEVDTLREEARQVEREKSWHEDNERVRTAYCQSASEEEPKVEHRLPVDAIAANFEPGRAQAPASVSSTEKAPAPQQIATHIVDAIHVGHDQHARKIVMVDVHIPGKGDVRIRLRRQGDDIEVRMRTNSQDLARELRQGRDTLREAGREKGLHFSTIDIVS
jgi:hypothetical protein